MVAEIKERIAENIAVLYRDLDGRVNRTAIFKHYRDMDESEKYPILGEFNVTDRTIQRLYRWEREFGEKLNGLELCYWIEDEMSRIVNSEL